MQTQFVDLHIHSTCSDGYLSPEEIVVRARQAGLAAIALADHDSIAGIERARTAAIGTGLEVLTAVEMSTQWYHLTDMHLLGYGFAVDDPYLTRILQDFQGFRRQRSEQIIERINRKLVAEQRQPLSIRSVHQLAVGSVGRPHIAQALRQAGHVASNDEAFVRYLIPCNVPKHYFPVDQAIRTIHASGGVAVLAHPPYISRDRAELRRLISELNELGLDGLEAYNNGSVQSETDWLIGLAREQGLIVTGGSDFHGDPGAAIEIGRGVRGIRVPYACVEELKNAINQRRLNYKECRDG